MKTLTVPLDKIRLSRWRDLELFPIDQGHVEELKESIGRHGFAAMKARRQVLSTSA